MDEVKELGEGGAEKPRYAILDTIMPSAPPIVRQRLEMAFDAGIVEAMGKRPVFESAEAFNDAVHMQGVFQRAETARLAAENEALTRRVETYEHSLRMIRGSKDVYSSTIAEVALDEFAKKEQPNE